MGGGMGVDRALGPKTMRTRNASGAKPSGRPCNPNSWGLRSPRINESSQFLSRGRYRLAGATPCVRACASRRTPTRPFGDRKPILDSGKRTPWETAWQTDTCETEPLEADPVGNRPLGNRPWETDPWTDPCEAHPCAHVRLPFRAFLVLVSGHCLGNGAILLGSL